MLKSIFSNFRLTARRLVHTQKIVIILRYRITQIISGKIIKQREIYLINNKNHFHAVVWSHNQIRPTFSSNIPLKIWAKNNFWRSLMKLVLLTCQPSST